MWGPHGNNLLFLPFTFLPSREKERGVSFLSKFSCSLIKLYPKRLQGPCDARPCNHMPSPQSFVVKITSEMKGKLLSFSKIFETSHTKSLWQSPDEHHVLWNPSQCLRQDPHWADPYPSILPSGIYGLPGTKMIYLIRNTIDSEGPEAGWTKGSPHSVPLSCLRRTA